MCQTGMNIIVVGLTRKQAELGTLARQAVRTPNKRNIEKIAKAKAAIAEQKKYAADHLGWCEDCQNRYGLMAQR